MFAYLINFEQQVGETTTNFIERFSKLSNKFTLQLLGSEYVFMVVGNMHP